MGKNNNNNRFGLVLLFDRKDSKDLYSSLFFRPLVPPPAPSVSILSPQCPFSSRWDWIYEMQNWDMKIYNQHEAVSALFKVRF